jgi:hypothetical protein
MVSTVPRFLFVWCFEELYLHLKRNWEEVYRYLAVAAQSSSCVPLWALY